MNYSEQQKEARNELAELQKELCKIREAQNIKKAEVCRMGIFSSIDALSNFESGKQPARLATFLRYVDFLGKKILIIEK